MHGLGRYRTRLDYDRRDSSLASLAKNLRDKSVKGADFSFVQISDSHIGFNKPANPDVTRTLQVAIDKINAMPHKPDFMIHTGDLTHLSKPASSTRWIRS